MNRHQTSSLKRNRARFEPKRRFTLFCEGANTEPAYFEAFGKQCGNVLLAIEIVPHAGGPYTIAEKAAAHLKDVGLSKRSRKKLDSFEEKDQVWGVFDRDEHPRYEDAITLCSAAGVGVARSNPCFEVWLILHETNYDKPSGRHDVQTHLAGLRPEYDPSGRKLPACGELIKRVEEAEKRAELQLQRRDNEGMPFGPPSTTVFRLTREIRKAALHK